MKIAIIGSGVAGLGAAYLLQRQFDVTLYEAGAYPGGHVNTISVPDPAGLQHVDTGFIVYNTATYPNLIRLFDELGVETQPSDMSFSFSHRGHDFEYSSYRYHGLFARRRNLISPTFWRLLWDHERFDRDGRKAMGNPRYMDHTLGQYLDEKRFSSGFVNYFLLPLASAVWSAPQAAIRDFPLQYLLHFYHNHGVLINPRPVQWRTITGGSRMYVQKLLQAIDIRLQLDTPVVAIQRSDTGVTLTLDGGQQEQFDNVIIATHSDQALAMLADPSPEETDILGRIPYEQNKVVLHTDTRLLPRRRAAWASWNYTMVPNQQPDHPATLTYWMNSLQSLSTDTNYCVTVNPQEPIQPDKIIRTIQYAHPAYSLDSLAARRRLPEINGRSHTFYCGAYFGYGFHEDGLKAGVAVAEQLGAAWS